MSILVNKATKVITQRMTPAARIGAAGVIVDLTSSQTYITHILCTCGI